MNKGIKRNEMVKEPHLIAYSVTGYTGLMWVETADTRRVMTSKSILCLLYFPQP